LRDLLNDNDKFLGLLKAIQQKFSHSSVKTETLLLFMNEYLGEEYDWLFYQYLKIPGVPVLVFQQNTVDGQVVLRYRWENIYPGFRLPAFVNLNGEGPTETMPWKKIVPESEWKEWNTGLPMVDILNVDEFSGYFIWRNEADKD
jgi:aminopeptidase N